MSYERQSANLYDAVIALIKVFVEANPGIDHHFIDKALNDALVDYLHKNWAQREEEIDIEEEKFQPRPFAPEDEY